MAGHLSFPESLHVGRPNIGNREKFLARVNTILDNRWFTNNGPFVQELESRIAGFLHAEHVVAVCNGTLALELAIRACGLKGEVIVPSFTFVATVHALALQGITPVFCDVDPETHNIDPDQIESLITPRTTGILAVHLWGRPCNIESLESIAQKNQLELIFDAAHAFACTHDGVMVGSFGHAEAFSFHATKFFNTLEGGAVVTADDELADRIRRMRDFGYVSDNITAGLGTNAKMNEVSAAMGLSLMENIDELLAINRAHYLQYQEALTGIPGLRMVQYDSGERRNYQYIILEIDPEASGIHRDQLQMILKAENVLARRYFYPGVHRLEPYFSLYPDAGKRLPVTESLADSLLALPTGSAVSENDVAEVCQMVRFIITNAAEFKARLRSLDSLI